MLKNKKLFLSAVGLAAVIFVCLTQNVPIRSTSERTNCSDVANMYEPCTLTTHYYGFPFSYAKNRPVIPGGDRFEYTSMPLLFVDLIIVIGLPAFAYWQFVIKKTHKSHIRLLASNRDKMVGWVVLGAVGWYVSFWTRAKIMNWPIADSFSYDIPYNLCKLLVAEIMLLPAVTIVVWGLISSVRTRSFSYTLLHTIGLIIFICLVLYFALPVLHPLHPL